MREPRGRLQQWMLVAVVIQAALVLLAPSEAAVEAARTTSYSLDSFVMHTVQSIKNQGFSTNSWLLDPKITLFFSPTNAPGEPSGGRGADFTWPWTCIFSVVAVFMDALSKACMAC